MGKFGWGAIYATEALFAAPAIAGAAVVAAGYWLDDRLRKSSHHPLVWEADPPDDMGLDRQLADLAADYERQRSRPRGQSDV
jgi:hypothetical protein